MYNFYYYDDNGYHKDTAWKFLMAFGVMVVLAGLLILLVPQILVLIIASTIFAVGGLIVANAWQLRKLSHRGQRIKIKWFD